MNWFRGPETEGEYMFGLIVGLIVLVVVAVLVLWTVCQ